MTSEDVSRDSEKRRKYPEGYTEEIFGRINETVEGKIPAEDEVYL